MTPPPASDASVIASPSTKKATTSAISGSIYKNAPALAVVNACNASYHAMYASPEQKTPRKATQSQPLEVNAGTSIYKPFPTKSADVNNQPNSIM